MRIPPIRRVRGNFGINAALPPRAAPLLAPLSAAAAVRIESFLLSALRAHRIATVFPMLTAPLFPLTVARSAEQFGRALQVINCS